MNEIGMQMIMEQTPGGNKKRGRKAKGERAEYQLNKDQTKFFVDLSKDKRALESVFSLLQKANEKDYGRKITFRELALLGIKKITSKDIDKLQEQSLSKMERVERALKEFNSKNNTNLTMGEFLIKKLSL